MLHELQSTVLVQHVRVDQVFLGVALQFHTKVGAEEPAGDGRSPSHGLRQAHQRNVEPESAVRGAVHVQKNPRRVQSNLLRLRPA